MAKQVLRLASGKAAAGWAECGVAKRVLRLPGGVDDGQLGWVERSTAENLTVIVRVRREKRQALKFSRFPHRSSPCSVWAPASIPLTSINLDANHGAARVVGGIGADIGQLRAVIYRAT